MGLQIICSIVFYLLNLLFLVWIFSAPYNVRFDFLELQQCSIRGDKNMLGMVQVILGAFAHTGFIF